MAGIHLTIDTRGLDQLQALMDEARYQAFCTSA